MYNDEGGAPAPRACPSYVRWNQGGRKGRPYAMRARRPRSQGTLSPQVSAPLRSNGFQ